jgi:hypothetical protein
VDVGRDSSNVWGQGSQTAHASQQASELLTNLSVSLGKRFRDALSFPSWCCFFHACLLLGDTHILSSRRTTHAQWSVRKRRKTTACADVWRDLRLHLSQ